MVWGGGNLVIDGEVWCLVSATSCNDLTGLINFRQSRTGKNYCEFSWKGCEKIIPKSGWVVWNCCVSPKTWMSAPPWDTTAPADVSTRQAVSRASVRRDSAREATVVTVSQTLIHLTWSFPQVVKPSPQMSDLVYIGARLPPNWRNLGLSQNELPVPKHRFLPFGDNLT